ncbi:MAG: CRISPR-associated endonuclease Cas1 [Candidatus Aenigmatarchaeota archaeon]
MEIVVSEFGTFIKKNGNRFEFKSKNVTEEFSADNLNQIIVTCNSVLSTAAIELAMKNDIDIVFVNKFGQPYARIYPCTLGGTTLTRKKQLEATGNIKGAILSKKFVEGKVKNQINFLKALNKSRNDENIKNKIKELENFILKLDELNGNKIEEIREQLLGIEGYIASEYFSCLSNIVPIKSRDTTGKDPFNAMLNYGYGILYSEIERACILAGLDPYLGFYHTDRYGKPCMVLDLIEEFRPIIVDRSIVTLFVQKQVEDKDFQITGDSFLLSESGRRKVIEVVLKRLNTKIKISNSTKSFQNIILDEARKVVRFLLEENFKYEPFVHRW